MISSSSRSFSSVVQINPIADRFRAVSRSGIAMSGKMVRRARWFKVHKLRNILQIAPKGRQSGTLVKDSRRGGAQMIISRLRPSDLDSAPGASAYGRILL
jgi:hypothetical protein